jgi:hypothetical protein
MSKEAVSRKDWNERHAVAFRGLEAEICDLSNMAGIAYREIDQAICDQNLRRDRFDRVMFIITHLETMD